MTRVAGDTGALYEPDLPGCTLLVSFTTLAELDRWAFESWGRAAEVTVAATVRGCRIECADAWIAATALRHDIPPVTHNRGDYLGIPGLKLISHGQ